jgi:nucleoside-triphosphatase
MRKEAAQRSGAKKRRKERRRRNRVFLKNPVSSIITGAEVPGMGRTLLLTGRPGIGKTTVIKAVAEALGNRAGGFTTEEMRGPGGREGFRLATLDGQAAVMAHVNLRGKGRPRVGRYGVDVGAIECVGVAALRRAVQERCIVVVDEIGKMELFCGPFKDIVLRAVGGPHTVIATVMARPNPWVDALKAMPQVEVWEVTAQSRDEMAEKVLRWLER